MQNVSVANIPQVGRKLRRPTHSHGVRFRPWQVQPFLIAPVLPGDTMKNLLLQAKTVTDPLGSTLTGWHLEHMFFYVKLRDLDIKDELVNMLLTNTPCPSAAHTASAELYANGKGINFTQRCLKAVVQHYFRSEEEVQGNPTSMGPLMHGLPQCKVNNQTWLESVKHDVDTPLPNGTPLAGDAYEPLPAHLSGFAQAYEQWKQMQAVAMAPPTFDDFLKTYGVKTPKAEKEEVFKPELLRYCREWRMPAVTVDPATGAAGGACIWDTSERADKDRFFAEPGFIFGVKVARPKIYMGKQAAPMSHFLNDAYSWLPALLSADPFTSLKKFVNDDGPLNPVAADEYWVDVADLFMNGDQFVHNVPDFPRVSLPDMSSFYNDTGDAEAHTPIIINKDYASEAEADALFKDTTRVATSKLYIRSEGRVDLNILSRVQDTTP